MEYITLVLAAVAVVLGIVVLSKVNKLITMLHTPIVKRVSDTNLKPNRHPVNAQDMAARNDRHEGGRGNERRERGNTAGAGRQDRNFNRDRNGRNDRRNGRNDRRRDFAETSAPAAPVETAPVAPAAQAPVAPAPQASVPAAASEAPRTEGRRPLPPRVQATLPEAPVPAAPASTPVVEEAPAAAEFEPSKVRYGRRNAIKKIPLEETAEESKA